MPINDRLDKENGVHINRGYYAAIKRHEIISFAETWMELEAIILSNRNTSSHLYVGAEQ